MPLSNLAVITSQNYLASYNINLWKSHLISKLFLFNL